MAKKNFSAGLEALLGSSGKTAPENKPAAPATPPPTAAEAPAAGGLNAQLLEQLNHQAFWEKRPVTEILNEAVAFYLDFQVELKERPKE
jgi:hypothetical protein